MKKLKLNNSVCCVILADFGLFPLDIKEPQYKMLAMRGSVRPDWEVDSYF